MRALEWICRHHVLILSLTVVGCGIRGRSSAVQSESAAGISSRNSSQGPNSLQPMGNDELRALSLPSNRRTGAPALQSFSPQEWQMKLEKCSDPSSCLQFIKSESMTLETDPESYLCAWTGHDFIKLTDLQIAHLGLIRAGRNVIIQQERVSRAEDCGKKIADSPILQTMVQKRQVVPLRLW